MPLPPPPHPEDLGPGSHTESCFSQPSDYSRRTDKFWGLGRFHSESEGAQPGQDTAFRSLVSGILKK